MHDPLAMRSVQYFGHLNGQVQLLLHLHRLPVDWMFQWRAIQMLHCNERLPSQFADIANGANVGMV